MNYNLNKLLEGEKDKKVNTFSSLKSLLNLIHNEKKNLVVAFAAIIVNSLLLLIGPLIIGYAVDNYVQTKDFDGVLRYALVLLAIYLTALVANYLQTILMGGIGQRMLYELRNAIFTKLQELPVAFFNQNKAGDLISRINNDTDKLNTFFSQSLMRFIGSLITMVGAGIFLLSINIELGSAALAPAVLIYLFTKVVSPWIKKKNAISLKSVGGLSAEIQESLNNFKVIIAFNRRDYFRKRFKEVNEENYNNAVWAGLANNLLMPVYGLFTNVAQMIVLLFGIYLISAGSFSVGLLVSFFAYANSFYSPLRQLAALWSSFQVALAGWDRIAKILAMESNLTTLENSAETNTKSDFLLEFKNVHFAYPGGNEILHNINFKLEKGKTYALVGPTGGGKSTTASLISRLYDPVEGTVFFQGRDMKTLSPQERSKNIGFILQEPFLFSGSLRDNILYGNEHYKDIDNAALEKVIKDAHLGVLLEKFDDGLETQLTVSGDAVSLGQKQLIAFIRAVLRQPALLILDEATANVDTVTEKLLDDILNHLPKETTKVIIAHRLNTIESADEIFFVNSGEVIPAGSMQHAVDMLLHGERAS
ncbi:ATP-binding cassette domain-containing protein [bacterium]|nr:ATP-binding cassette domain-containing protein [bacterium]